MNANAMPYSLDLRTYSTECNAHSHDWYQLVFAVQGQLEMSIAQQSGVVSTACGALLVPGTEHAFAAEGDNCFVVVDLLPALSAQLNLLPAWFSLTPTANKYLQFLAVELRSPSQFANSSVNPVRLQMVRLLLEMIRPQPENRESVDRRVTLVCDYMLQNPGEPLTVARLAQLVHLSPRQLSFLFRQHHGVSIQNFLLKLRMELAEQLLRDTQLPIQQVAERCGYGNLSAFSDRFRRYTGLSPRYYRRDY